MVIGFGNYGYIDKGHKPETLFMHACVHLSGAVGAWAQLHTLRNWLLMILFWNDPLTEGLRVYRSLPHFLFDLTLHPKAQK